jgi:hypothetical protein
MMIYVVKSKTPLITIQKNDDKTDCSIEDGVYSMTCSDPAAGGSTHKESPPFVRRAFLMGRFD